jgi:hypothetical protein
MIVSAYIRLITERSGGGAQDKNSNELKLEITIDASQQVIAGQLTISIEKELERD